MLVILLFFTLTMRRTKYSSISVTCDRTINFVHGNWTNFRSPSTGPTGTIHSTICLRPFSTCCSTTLWLLPIAMHLVMATQEKAKKRFIDFSGPSLKTNGKPLTAINHELQAPCNIPLSLYSFCVFASQVLSPMFFSLSVSDLALKISSNTRHREPYGMSSN